MDSVRPDGRSSEAFRPLRVALGVLERADGSSLLSLGETRVLVSVYGPLQSELSTRSGGVAVQTPREGTCQVTWLEPEPTLSDILTTTREAHRGGVQGAPYPVLPLSAEQAAVRSRATGLRRHPAMETLLERLFSSVIILMEYASSCIHVIVQVLHHDGGTLAAAVIAASLALMDAGVSLRGFLVAVPILARSIDHEQADVSWLVDPTLAELRQQSLGSSLWVVDQTGNICYCRLEAPFALGTSAPASLSDINASMYLEWHQDAYRIAAGAAEKLCSWLRSVMESQIKDALPEIQ